MTISTPKNFHECVTGIKELVHMAQENYKSIIIDSFAAYIFGDDYNYHKEQGKSATIVYLDKHFDTIFEQRRIRAIEYLIGTVQGTESKWSGGFSVSNMMDQVRRDVILNIIGNRYDTQPLVKKRMLELVEEWE